MGGLICFLFAARFPAMPDGLICLSPAFKSRLKFSILGYARIFFRLIFNPKKQVPVPFDSGMCTRDVSYQKIMDSDLKEHRLATPRLLANIFFASFGAARAKREIVAPVLFLVAGENDLLTDPAAAEKIFSGIRTKDKEIVRYPGMCHALSIELGREQVFGDVLNWIRKRL